MKKEANYVITGNSSETCSSIIGYAIKGIRDENNPDKDYVNITIGELESSNNIILQTPQITGGVIEVTGKFLIDQFVQTLREIVSAIDEMQLEDY